MRQHGGLIRFSFALALASFSTFALALELQFQSPPPETPPKRRLVADPAQPEGAPTSLLIEVAGIQESAETALQLATKAMGASKLAYGDRDPRLVIPLTNLGIARQRAGKSDLALNDFKKAIALAEAEGGPRDSRLFDAWYGLGMAHYSSGRPTSAAQAFETALHVNKVNEGLYQANQLEVMHALALCFREAGMIEGAKLWQQRRLEVANKAISKDAERSIRTYISVGRWMRDQGEIATALALHHEAVAKTAALNGTESPKLIGPLLDLAISARLRRPKYGEATAFRNLLPESPLGHARRIAENSREETPAERGRRLMHIGDVYWIVGRAAQAKQTYGKAVELLGKDLTESPLAKPAFIAFAPPEPSAREKELGGYLLAEFTVSNLGRARNARIVEGTHPWLIETIGRRLIGALRSARFRPRIENGRPVHTRDVRYRLILNRDDADRAGAIARVTFEPVHEDKAVIAH